MRDLGFALPPKSYGNRKNGPIPSLHLLRGIPESPINVILRNRAGPQKEEDKAAPQGAKGAGAGTSGVAILICI